MIMRTVLTIIAIALLPTCLAQTNVARVPSGSSAGQGIVAGASNLGLFTGTGAVVSTGGVLSALTPVQNKIIIGSGVPSWLVSDFTLAAPGAVGAVLYSDGTNWTRNSAPAISAANMTSFPTLNQNTSGNAATATALSANQGTTTTVLHGNAAGTPAFAEITASDFGTQVANTVLAGPSTGADATPTYRALASVDIPQELSNKTLVTPTVASFANAAHDHSDAAGGGTLVTGTGTIKAVANVLGVIAGTSEDCVRANGSIGSCGTTASGTFIDNFLGTSLDAGWTSSANGGTITVADGKVALVTQTGTANDCNADGVGCVRITRAISATDYVITAKVDGTNPPNTSAGGWGIMLWADDDNFLRCEIYNLGTETRWGLFGVAGGAWVDYLTGTITLSTSTYLRCSKSGTNFILETSANGTDWTTRHTTALPTFVPSTWSVAANNGGTSSPQETMNVDWASISVAGEASPNAVTATSEWTASSAIPKTAASSGRGVVASGVTIDANNAVSAPGGLASTGTTRGYLYLGEAAAGGTSKIKFYAPAALAADVCYVLPAAVGSSGQVMKDSGTTETIDGTVCRILEWGTN